MDGPRFELGASPLPAKRSDRTELPRRFSFFAGFINITLSEMIILNWMISYSVKTVIDNKSKITFFTSVLLYLVMSLEQDDKVYATEEHLEAFSN